MAGLREPPSLATLRLIWVAFAISFLFIVRVGSLLTGAHLSRPGWELGLLAVVFLVWSPWNIYKIRAKFMQRAALRAASGDSIASARMRAVAHLIGFASAESIVLAGLLAHVMLHSPSWASTAFYCVGGALLILYWPTKPLSFAATP